MVGGIPTPLKNMSLSVGIMTFPTEWKVIKFHGSSHHQAEIYIYQNVWKTPTSEISPLITKIHGAERIRILGPDIATLRTCSSSGFFNGSRAGESPCLTGKSSSYIYIYISVYIYIYWFIDVSIHLFIDLIIHLFVYLCIYLYHKSLN